MIHSAATRSEFYGGLGGPSSLNCSGGKWRLCLVVVCYAAAKNEAKIGCLVAGGECCSQCDRVKIRESEMQS